MMSHLPKGKGFNIPPWLRHCLP